jgi:hypothetical protein
LSLQGRQQSARLDSVALRTLQEHSSEALQWIEGQRR